jgi:hypothetical protein
MLNIKNWKLVNKIRFPDKYEDIYVNQKTGNTIVINKASQFTHAKKGYSVFSLYTRQPKHYYFKTKTKTSAFVKEYMKGGRR